MESGADYTRHQGNSTLPTSFTENFKSKTALSFCFNWMFSDLALSLLCCVCVRACVAVPQWNTRAEHINDGVFLSLVLVQQQNEYSKGGRLLFPPGL